MKILVTGGAGYIGTELVRQLVQLSEVESVVVYDNLSRSNFNFFLGQPKYNGADKIRFIQGELLDSRSLTKALSGVDIVYHLAAKVTTPFANTDPHFYEQVNHWGTAELVYALESSQVKKIVYASSLGIYGSSDTMVNEETVPNPKTFYGTSKLRGEEHIRRLSEKLSTYIIRCGNVYGYSPSMRFDAVINKFVFESHFNKLIQIHGDGKQSRGFIHIDMLAQILTQLVSSDLPGGIYNAVHRNLQVLDIVDELKQLIPNLEFLFINQHLKLREVKGEPNEKLLKLAPERKQSLREELQHFLNCFRF